MADCMREPCRSQTTMACNKERNSRLNSMVSEKLQTQWEHMRKFSLDTKRSELKCPFSAPGDIPCETRPLKTFSTGSKYEGTWDIFGMCGYGTYTFPNGVIYVGEFENNLFHGDGQLKYTDGTTVKGKWNQGTIIESTIVFEDGVEYKDHDWDYCVIPDRRFASEFFDDIQPAGASYLAEPHPPIEIPPGYYDTGDGFYNPETALVYKYDDLTSVIRCVMNTNKWIIENCRTAPDDPVGPRPDLYETWLQPELELPTPPLPHVLSDAISNESLDVYALALSLSAAHVQRKTEMSAWVKKEGFNYDPVDTFQPKTRPRSQITSHHSRLHSRSGSVEPEII